MVRQQALKESLTSPLCGDIGCTSPANPWATAI